MNGLFYNITEAITNRLHPSYHSSYGLHPRVPLMNSMYKTHFNSLPNPYPSQIYEKAMMMTGKQTVSKWSTQKTAHMQTKTVCSYMGRFVEQAHKNGNLAEIGSILLLSSFLGNCQNKAL